jgi:C-terminal processing protease CtpA/Prc
MSRCSARSPIRSSLARPSNGTEPGPGIVYFDLNGAKNDALGEVFERLESAKGIVFDVRGYPADAAMKLLVHLHDGRTASARWNVPVVTLPDREGWSWHESAWDLPPDKRQLTAKIAFLTDGRAISYAESILGIVEHYKLGEIVGGATAGTNGNVNPFDLPGGYRVSWTGMKVLKHDGSQHHGVGIRPTVPVEPTPAGIAAGRDEVLEKAVQVLEKQLAADGARVQAR